MNKQVTSEIEAAADAGADSRPVASSSRRRLIKLGASAVPVLATLSSPSALAGACVSTSAWGSTMGVQNGSHTHRKTTFTPNGFPRSDWNSQDDNEGTAWAAFKAKFSVNSNPSSYKFELLYSKLKTFYGDAYYLSPSTLGFAASTMVVGALTSDDKSYFMVAMLNYAVGKMPPTDCVTDATWRAIVNGTYPTVDTRWSVAQIGEYLRMNDIVQP